ncbi:MAG: tetratricopeptide repeat protein [Pseudomonadota bacterium]
MIRITFVVLCLAVVGVPRVLSADPAGEFRQALAARDFAAAEALLQAMPAGAAPTTLSRAALAEARGDVTAARGLLEALHERFPAQPEPLNNLAALEARQGNLDAARTLLERALATHPSYRATQANLARVYERLAARAYARALPEAGPAPAASLELSSLYRMPLPGACPP